MKCGVIVLCLMLAMPVTAAAQREEAQIDEQTQIQMEQTIDSLVNGLSLDDELRITIPGAESEQGIREAVRSIAKGETMSAEEALELLFRAAANTIKSFGALLVALMLPVLLGAIVTRTLGERQGELGNLCANVCFMLVLIPLISLVTTELSHAKETIVSMTVHMEKLLPILLALLTAVGGNASSAFMHPVVVAASGSMVFLAREVILRLVMCTCAVTAINHLSASAHLTRLAQLLRSAVCWLLGVSFTVFLGAMSLQGVCSASLDGVAIRAAKYAVDNFVPIVGGMFSDTMDTLVGCTLIVKNALGLVSVLVLCGALVTPLMSTAASVFALKLSAALLEPVAHRQVIAAIGDFSKTLVLFLITMLCVATMYFLLIVQILLMGNLTVMMR